MKNPVIFVLSSITLFRGERKMLASQKAGIFYSPKGVKAIVTCRGIPIMGLPVRSERVVLDSGKGQSLFCCPSNIKYHAHRNFRAYAPHSTRQNNAPLPSAKGGAAQASRKALSIFDAAFTRFYLTSAFPPAAFFHTQIFLIGLLLERG